MDPRLYMLAGTFSLLIIALAATIVSAIRATRRRRYVPGGAPATPWEWPALPPAPTQEADISLEGFELDVPGDSPSAVLLTPLRTGEWQPPEEPAPAVCLPDLSLDARLASFDAQRDMPRTPEVVEPESPAIESATPELAPSVLVSAPVILAPEPEPIAAPQPSPTPKEAAPVAPIDLPEQAIPAEFAEPVSEVTPDWAAAIPVVTTPLPAFDYPVPDVCSESFANEPQPVGDIPSEALGAFDWVPFSTQDAGVTVEPQPVPEPEPAPEPAPAATPIAEFAPELPAIPAPQPDVALPEPLLPQSPPEAPPAPEVAPSALPDDAFWESIYREHNELPSIVAVPEPVQVPAPAPDGLAATPEVTPPSLTEIPPAPVYTPSPEPAQTRPQRPRTVVRSIDVAMAGTSGSSVPTPPAATASAGAGTRSEFADMVMAAPIEMWFGDSRIGVKAGTKTYAQFRKFADVLLLDLAETTSRDR